MPPMPLRILLIEDDELFRLGLCVRLKQEADLQIVAEAEDGETAVELLECHSLDLVILDVGLPGIGGIEACRQIKQRQPQLPVLVLTSRSQPALIARLVEAGAQGYCLKGVAAELLILAIRSVAAGASWWDSTATAEIRTALRSPAPADQNPVESQIGPLTRREQEILALIAAGKTNQQIASQLYITPGTVRVHVHTILHKLGVNNRAEAARLGRQHELFAAHDSAD